MSKLNFKGCKPTDPYEQKPIHTDGFEDEMLPDDLGEDLEWDQEYDITESED